MRESRNKLGIFLFFFSIFLFAFFNSYWIAGMINFSISNMFVSLIWMLGFMLLTFNVGYMLINTIVSSLWKEMYLNEEVSDQIPSTAIVYVVRNEMGEALFKNMYHSLFHNFSENVDLWLLSNSDKEEFVDIENKVIFKLKNLFGSNRVNYFRAVNNPLYRKHICIQEWLNGCHNYKYFLVCDADSKIPEGALSKLVRKAEHPNNKDIALFQSHITIKEEPTYFVKFLRFGQDICQRLFTSTNQKIFGRSVSYGSGCLIRCEVFRKINVPDWALSHDIWDTIYLEEMGYRVVFCGDVITYGEFPVNYLEYTKRNQRWIKGTLESAEVVFKNRTSIGTKFMTLYPSYLYLSQPIFLIWIMIGFFLDCKLWRPLFKVQRYAFMGASYVDLEMGSHLLITMCVVIGHKFLGCKNIKEVGLIFVELLTSVLICLNNIFYNSLTVIIWFLKREKGIQWVPMKKGTDENMKLSQVVKNLWPTTLIGVFGMVFGFIYSLNWAIAALPFLISFTLGIPVVYFTGKKIGNK